jgi:WD40 repeat protein/transcriptional regulator with XRE-family HTH domain
MPSPFVLPNGEEILRLRAEKNLTQEDLAARAGYAKRTIENIEKGKRTKRMTLEGVAHVLGVAVEQLIVPGEPVPPAEPLPRATEVMGMTVRDRAVRDLRDLKRRLPDFAGDLEALETLLAVDVQSPLNKIRYITEKVLSGLCADRGVSWGPKKPTLENMIGPLLAAGHIPDDVAVHIRALQTVASPGSHFLTSPLSVSHVEIGLVALCEVLRWHAGLSRDPVSRPTPGRLTNVPELPPHFLPRPEELRDLKDALLGGDSQRVAITGQGRVGVQGMGGIGKSVLAAAVARDDQVRAAFRDGVHWLTLGQAPELTVRQAQLAEAVGGGPRAFADVQQGRARLGEVLAGRCCLLVLDDVWQVDHAAAFDALGPSGRMLLTTRDADVLAALGAAEHRLDLLAPDQALTLLAAAAGRRVEELPAVAAGLARECGYLPLALAMIGGMLQGKPADRWQGALDRLRRHDLESIRRQCPHYPYPTLLRAVQVSVDALEPGDRERYLDLAVFPEDTPVPEAALQTFWGAEGLKAYQVQDLADRFVARSLARRDERGCLSLHDLQHDFVCQQSGGKLAALHGRLLKAYAGRCPGGWPSGPDDGYFFEHLAYHLKEAGQRDALRDLLLDYGWMRARLVATGVAGLLADYDQLPDDADLRLVQGALRLSAHVLGQDPAQLGGQLLGRLLGQPLAIQWLLLQARLQASGPWLRPLVASLTPPGGPLLQILTGHGAGVSAVAVTPDGRAAVSASADYTLKVWDLASGQQRLTFAGHRSGVTAVAVTPDGQAAVSASLDYTLKVWDLASGQQRLSLTGHDGGVLAVAVTADGRGAVSGSIDGTLKVWDLASGHERLSFAGHNSAVCGVAVTADGRTAVSGSRDGTVTVWDLDSGQQRITPGGHSDCVRAVAVTPDGRCAVSASHDRTLKVWDLASGRERLSLTGHGDWVRAAAATPDGRAVVSASRDGTLKVWDLASGRERLSFAGHDRGVIAVAVTPDGRAAVSGSEDGTLKVWDLASGHERLSLTGPSDWVREAAVTPDGRAAVFASWDGTVTVWDLASGQERLSLAGHGAEVTAVAVTPDGRAAVSASFDGMVTVWDLDSGRQRLTLTGNDSPVSVVAVTPDGQAAISGSWGGTLKVWDLDSGHERLSFAGHKSAVCAVAVTPDGSAAVSGSWGGTLKVWDLDSGRERLSLASHRGGVSAVAVTPDGQAAISGSWGGTLKVWDLGTGHERRTLTGHGERVRAVAVTPDGHCAVSASQDRTLKVWDLDSGVLIATFVGDGGFLTCAVSPDGRTVIAGDQLGRVHFLRLEGV